MKKIVSILLSVVLLLSLCACVKTHVEPSRPLAAQVDEQLSGTWIANDSDTVMSKWTFHDGKYVVDTYINGNKIENSTVGIYAIGSDSIHTVAIDQKEPVEGRIAFTFEHGKLELHGANRDLEKE